MNIQLDKNLKEAVLNKITDENIKSRPKSFFILINILYLLAIILVTLFILFVISFVLFALQQSELLYLPIFGWRGIELLAGNFPWLLVLITIVFIGLLEFLVNRYGFVYRRPLLYSSLFIILSTVLMSYIIGQTPLQKNIYGKVKRGGVPILKQFYDDYTKPNPKHFHPGTVIKNETDGFILERADKSLISVKISSTTEIRSGFEIYPGGRLLIICQIIDDQIIAEAIDNAPTAGRP